MLRVVKSKRGKIPELGLVIQTGHMKTIAAAEFKAKCLALIDRVHHEGESITITKRGRTVARLVSAGDDERPWLRVRGTLRKYEDPFSPALDERDIDALT
jgi:prevent-host-death family protein